MNMKDQIRVLKAAKICGLKAYQSKLISGSRCVRLTYNRAGDSILFNPLQDIGQAMDMLIHLGGSLIVNNKESSCTVCITKEGTTEVCSTGGWRSNEKNKKKNICNAIVNCILMVNR